MKRVVGLDIGSFSIKAVEIAWDRKGKPKVTNFGLVTLPSGAMASGARIEPEILVKALKRLWTRAEFATKDVVIGTSGDGTFIRESTLPVIPDSEMKSVIATEAMEFLPGSIDDYRIDYERRMLPEPDDSGASGEVHLVAVDISIVSDLQSIVREAGLEIVGIDSSVMALFRGVWLNTDIGILDLPVISVKSTSPTVEPAPQEVRSSWKGRLGKRQRDESEVEVEPSSQISEGSEETQELVSLEGTSQSKVVALVMVGANRVTVGIAEDGVLTVSRSIDAQGGDAITRAISEELNVAVSDAEGLKRSLGESGGDQVEFDGDVDGRRLSEIVRSQVAQLVEAIVNTLNSYLFSRGGEGELRIFIGGGGSLTTGLLDSLNEALGADRRVERLELFETIDFDMPDLSAAERDRISAVMPDALSLALGMYFADNGRHVINLQGDEVLKRRQAKRDLTIALSGFLVGLLVFGALDYLHVRNENNLNNELTSVNAEVNSAQSSLSQLSSVAKTRSALAAQEQQLSGILASDVAWPVLINQLNAATPSDVWWTNFSGVAPSGTTNGSITFGAAGCSQQAPAHWLNALGTLNNILDPWVSSSVANQSSSCVNAPLVNGAPAPTVSFNSTATIANNPTPSRFQEYLTGQGISQ
ncbi:MAG: pilus assembly protein PilM [Actinomycetota bacterium]|nr:pilus assembly protein PilM [Actinomycetota bacterium]